MFGRHLILALLLPILTLQPPTFAAKQMLWGVNGHPGMQVAYIDVPVGTQISAISTLGAQYYRTDWREDMVRANPGFYDNLVKSASARGIRILPVIFPTTNCRNCADPTLIRASAAQFGQWIAKRYKGKITTWELDNELDNRAILRKGDVLGDGSVWPWGSPDGDNPGHYLESRYQMIRAELIGLNQGIKAGDSKAQTIIDSAGWLHYGFFERLIRRDKVPFDILGWHWYSEMGDMTKVRGSFNVLNKLGSYGKPIWVTELNRRGGSLGLDGERSQADYITALCSQLKANANVKAVFCYELLDEPCFGAANPESYYGLIQVMQGPDRVCRITRSKPAFDAFRRGTLGIK